MDDDFVTVNRKIVNWELYTAPHCAQILLHLIILAQWRDRKVVVRGRSIRLKRGQCWITIRQLADQLGLSKKQVERALTKISKSGTATVENVGQQFSIVTLHRYSFYQSKQARPGDSKGTGQGTARGQQGDSKGTQNNKETRKQENNPPKSPRECPTLMGVKDVGEQMIQAWNAHATLHHPILKTTEWLTAGREQKLRDAFEEVPQFDGFWYQALAKTPVQKQLAGWQPTFDWLLDVDNVRKLIDGNYDEPKKPKLDLRDAPL